MPRTVPPDAPASGQQARRRRRAGFPATGTALIMAALTVLATSLVTMVLPTPAEAASPPTHPFAGSGVVPFGDARGYSAPTMTLSSMVTGMAPTPDGAGYWLVGTDGGVFAFGDAGFYGSLGALTLNGPIVGMAPTPSGRGYWLVALDGGVFAFGDAGFYGSMGATPLNEPIVGMASTPSGHGYWMVAADGGVFAFGDAGFYGSMGATHIAAAVTGMASTPSGHGYWMVAADGGVFAFGDAGFYGSMGGETMPASIAGIATTPGGEGYWMVGNDGTVYPFGDAQGYGSSSGTQPVSPVTAIAATPDGKGYWLLQPDDWSYSFAGSSPYVLGSSSAITSVAAHQVGPDPDNTKGAFCNPYGPCEPWCALFATWVWGQAGIPVPSLAFTGSIFSWAASHGRLLPASATPAPGDAVLYGTGPQSTATSVHTGIIVQVWPDGAVITVEGDAGPFPNGAYNVVVNGPFLPADSAPYNGVPVYAIAQPAP
ncbi:MAG TPA: CHAP domain-containing protein [Acidimicrobiales bacterium]|nr:CHAP domain-containing protein [Acidimicrobiales bacterium]